MTRRNLPHWQVGGHWYFVTFRLRNGTLDDSEKNIALFTLKESNGIRADISAAVVMPDHIHLLLKPRLEQGSGYFSLSSILKPIKGVSARKINQKRRARGSLWQAESFDRLIRNEKEWHEKYEYIINNPVKAGLVKSLYEYPWYLQSEVGY